MSDYPLTPEVIQDTADKLSQLEPGFLPLPIFLQITRLAVTSIVEVVPLRKNGDAVEVLLLKRPADDPHWPNQLHTPGTVLRPTDREHNYSDAFKRILNDELGITTPQEPTFVTTVFHRVNRGTELALVFYLEIPGETASGDFYDSDKLPSGVVETQLEFIKASV
ncbi:MAG: NUDIX domain-containing protein, partial [Candidatus Saccharimonadales bacterium]